MPISCCYQCDVCIYIYIHTLYTCIHIIDVCVYMFWMYAVWRAVREASVAFLTAAGLDFPRHAAEGIDPAEGLDWRVCP